MSTIKSSDEHLTLNADGSSKDIKFQANGVEKASISSSGAFTSTTIDATKLTGDLPAISGANLTGVGVAGISSSADATAITISSDEKVGIGETSPTTHLLCLGEDSGSGDSGASSGISFRASNTENYISMSTVGGANNGARGLVINREGSNELIKFCGDGRGKSQFTIAAWVNFNGTGTVAIRDSHNVSSMGDWGTGQYGIYFTSGFANSNYAYASMAQDSRIVSVERDNGKPDGGRLDVSCERSWDAALTDNETLSVLVIGDQS